MDTKKRSLVKSITWRVIGIIILSLISYLITKSWQEMTIITVLFHSIRFFLYYFHERIWEHISWGKLTSPLCEFPVMRELSADELETVKATLVSLGVLR